MLRPLKPAEGGAQSPPASDPNVASDRRHAAHARIKQRHASVKLLLEHGAKRQRCPSRRTDKRHGCGPSANANRMSSLAKRRPGECPHPTAGAAPPDDRVSESQRGGLHNSHRGVGTKCWARAPAGASAAQAEGRKTAERDRRNVPSRDGRRNGSPVCFGCFPRFSVGFSGLTIATAARMCALPAEDGFCQPGSIQTPIRCESVDNLRPIARQRAHRPERQTVEGRREPGVLSS